MSTEVIKYEHIPTEKERYSKKYLKSLPYKNSNSYELYDKLIIFYSGKKHHSGFGEFYVIGYGVNGMHIITKTDAFWFNITDNINSKNYKYGCNIRFHMMYKDGVQIFYSDSFNFATDGDPTYLKIDLVDKNNS